MKPSAHPSKFDETALPGNSLWVDESMPRPLAHASMFDACHVGVVLRVVLFVEAVTGVGAMFGTAE